MIEAERLNVVSKNKFSKVEVKSKLEEAKLKQKA
jgi:hypothetical protein